MAHDHVFLRGDVIRSGWVNVYENSGRRVVFGECHESREKAEENSGYFVLYRLRVIPKPGCERRRVGQ